MTEAINPDTIAQADQKQAQSMRGRNAQLILDNPVFAEAWDAMHEEIIKRMKTEGVVDPMRQQLLAIQLQQLDRLAHNFASMVRAGKVADADLQEMQRKLQAEQERLDREAKGFIARGMRNARSAFAHRQ